MQKIIIRNFGPIKECEIDLAQFIVLTGAQATGKSTVAKVVYYFLLAKEICFSVITGSKNRSVDILRIHVRQSRNRNSRALRKFRRRRKYTSHKYRSQTFGSRGHGRREWKSLR